MHFVFLADNFYVDDYARFTFLDSKDKTAAVTNSMTYLTKKGIVMGELRCTFILKQMQIKAYSVPLYQACICSLTVWHSLIFIASSSAAKQWHIFTFVAGSSDTILQSLLYFGFSLFAFYIILHVVNSF